MFQNTLIVSNWKMNLNLSSAYKLVKSLEDLKLPKSKTIKHIICPQFLLIPEISKIIKNKDILIGSQDCHYKTNGSFTGDSSIQMIKHYNCKYSIVGHSERRIVHNETNEIVYDKADLLSKNKLIPIICIGESIEIRKKNKIFETLSKQILESIPKSLEYIIIAYEPIWAIGTGVIPSIQEIFEVKDFVINFLKKNKFSEKVSFLYGGSVDSSNIGEIIKKSQVNGVLVGGASIKFNEIKKILSYCYFN